MKIIVIRRALVPTYGIQQKVHCLCQSCLRSSLLSPKGENTFCLVAYMMTKIITHQKKVLLSFHGVCFTLSFGLHPPLYLLFSVNNLEWLNGLHGNLMGRNNSQTIQRNMGTSSGTHENYTTTYIMNILYNTISKTKMNTGYAMTHSSAGESYVPPTWIGARFR